jgi:uncharacterized protein involved in exopolysaccharide biosynthesis
MRDLLRRFWKEHSWFVPVAVVTAIAGALVATGAMAVLKAAEDVIIFHLQSGGF